MSYLTITKDNYAELVENSPATVLLDFWAPWCGPCRMVVPMVEQIAAERPDVKVGKINIDQEYELARQFGISSIPTLMVLKEGRIVRQSTGAMPKNKILEMLN